MAKNGPYSPSGQKPGSPSPGPLASVLGDIFPYPPLSSGPPTSTMSQDQLHLRSRPYPPQVYALCHLPRSPKVPMQAQLATRHIFVP